MKRMSVQYHGKETNISLPGAGVLSAIFTVVDKTDDRPGEEDDASLQLGGLDSTTNEHIEWDRVTLCPGDIIQIAIHDDQKSDPPRSRRSSNSKGSIEFTKERVRSLAAELGWTINEDPNDK